MKKIIVLLVCILGSLQLASAQKFVNKEVTFTSADGKIHFAGMLSRPEGTAK